jgi:asparagine synthetase B (glutamine-hydrolysing)
MNIKNLLTYPNIILNKNYCQINNLENICESNGQYAVLNQSKNALILDRDILGLNKLFYGIDKSTNEIVVGNTLYEIYKANPSISSVKSQIPGKRLEIDLNTLECVTDEFEDLSTLDVTHIEDFNLTSFQNSIHNKLSSYFKFLSKKFRNKKIFVCLSGGLDSSIIAYYAKKHFDNITAITFSLTSSKILNRSNPLNQNNYDSHISSSEVSDDYKKALRFSRELDIPFIGIFAENKISLNSLKDVLIYGQDYRDFNVHCAWVNYKIGKKIKNLFPEEDCVFLTGDLMNEFVADYKPVIFENIKYYTLPKLPTYRLNKILTYGLECGDREIGIFNHFNITTVQPFSTVFREYLKLPNEMFNRPDLKEHLNSSLIQDEHLRKLINTSKVRAQVGGSDGGVLALFIKNKIRQKDLKKIWIDAFNELNHSDTDFNSMIAFGHYRF